LAFVRHQANAPSGGQVTDVETGDFLSGAQHPEQAALLRLIGTLMVDPQGAEVGNELAAEAGREWSDAELNELGEMLVRGLSIGEIARSLRRNHRGVRDKIVEVGQACR
jgi:hypothetical protein